MRATLPHYVKIQIGSDPDSAKDGQACIHINSIESPDEIGLRLAQTALALSSASKFLSHSEEQGTIINVDGVDCNVLLSEFESEQGANQLAAVLSGLVVPSGWNSA